MKNLICATLCTFLLFSCSKNEETTTENEPQNITVKESFALRGSLEEFKSQNAGRLSERNANDLCFNFEYPIVVSYNTNTEITVNDFEQLLDLLLNETNASHIVGIGFPFNAILVDGTVLTINNEAEFQTLIENCGYDVITVPEVMAVVGDCFDVNYPITLIVNEVEKTFTSQQEVENYFIGNTESIISLRFGYPLSVTLLIDGSTNVIEDDFGLIQLLTETCGID